MPRIFFVSLLSFVFSLNPALAFFKLCNNSDEHVFVAIGYDGGEEWIAEGWWGVEANECVNIIDQSLTNQYYYIRAERDDGGIWEGDYYFCTTDERFTLIDSEDCISSKINRQGFFEVDTEDSRSWTHTLVE